MRRNGQGRVIIERYMGIAEIRERVALWKLVKPRTALRSLRKLIADPSDTEEAFRVVRSLDGPAVAKNVRRMRTHPVGMRILEERPDLLARLRNTKALAALPEGSVGRAYRAFCELEGITPGGLVEASNNVPMPFEGDELRYFANRMRDAHDLWHLVAGYRTDLLGELAVLVFSYTQGKGPGVALLAAGGLFESLRYAEFGRDLRTLARGAWRRGNACGWLPAIYWEEQLARPLEELRHELGLSAPPVYTPLYQRERDAFNSATQAA